MPAGQPAGVVVINFAKRRRLRINGVLTPTASAGVAIEVDQAYGNCPKYIQTRNLHVPSGSSGPDRTPTFAGRALRADDCKLIERADTFFLGTTHPASGSDASHRGGPAGFVTVDNDRLWWPDYPGNNLFNSLGNLAVDPSAALLFIDFRTGTTLQLSGAAKLTWNGARSDGDEHTGREVSFTPRRVVVTGIPGLRADSADASGAAAAD